MGIATLPIVDIRHLLLRRPSQFLVTRLLKLISGDVLHYNGPEVDTELSVDAEIRHLQAIAKYHVGKIWGYANGIAIYGHGIMYHYAVGATGTIYWLRNQSDILWHCGNGTGNNTTIAVHNPIGGKQRPTDKQWDSTIKLFNALAEDRGFNAKSNTKGHKEWGQSECPGVVLMPMLDAWRKEPAEPVIKRYEVVIADSNCREGPGLSFPIALNGAAVYQPGHQFSGRVVQGQTVGGVSEWVHRDDGIGFVNKGLLKEV
jgi:hypothetical protein